MKWGHWGLSCPVVLAALWMAGIASAAVDLSGAWTVQYQTLPTQSWTIVQSGSTLSVTVGGGSIAGTIDPQTGAFQLISPPTPCPVGIFATATPDSNAFSGTYTETTVSCPGGPQTCTCVPSSSEPVSGCRVGTCPAAAVPVPSLSFPALLVLGASLLSLGSFMVWFGWRRLALDQAST
jgi:hypothetical protein